MDALVPTRLVQDQLLKASGRLMTMSKVALKDGSS